MSAASLAARELSPHLDGIAGTLRMFGDWFGRPYDNHHVAIGLDADGDVLVIDFDGGERLEVHDPEGWRVERDGLRIDGATRVVWRWYHYGRPPTPENLRTIDLRRGPDGIRSTTDGERSVRPGAASPDAPAVEVLRQLWPGDATGGATR
ncbi:MAG: hypothetical protein M3Y51_08910 [Actinomycetota bacterium]|nr:hypothetical protein [Actinomycetota bacterium]